MQRVIFLEQEQIESQVFQHKVWSLYEGLGLSDESSK